MLYAHEFFKTEKDAKAFQQKRGGALYCGFPGSETAEDYRVEACVEELTQTQREDRPYCVVWNIVDEGPIQSERIIGGDE